LKSLALDHGINIQPERVDDVTYLRETDPSKEVGVSELGFSFENFFIPGDEIDGNINILILFQLQLNKVIAF